jgi:uncharacterized HAD superfamily protein
LGIIHGKYKNLLLTKRNQINEKDLPKNIIRAHNWNEVEEKINYLLNNN